MKFKTIREGEEAVIYNHLGEGRVIKGPERIFLIRERCVTMDHLTASPVEYLVVNYVTGEVQHIPGPCEIFRNPMDHQTITVQKGIHIDANHMLVVYRRLKGSDVERRVIQGPTMFFQSADEWLHTFEWHGPDPNELGHMIQKKAKFTKLASIPDQFYYNVRDVRTKDDTMLQVNLMIFYQLTDVIKMLEATHDPIADMINAVCADVIAFAGKRTFASFLEGVKALGQLHSYPQLQQRAEKIGYSVSKVVFRGYRASAQLQEMQNSAIQSRTRLRLDAELEEQRQKLADFKLRRERERTELRQQMERNRKEHQQRTERAKQEHTLRVRERSTATQLEIDALSEQARLECSSARLVHDESSLAQLRRLDVDLTEYLVRQQPAPVAHEYRIQTA